METFPIECKRFWPFSPKLFDSFVFFIVYSFMGMIFINYLSVSRVAFDYIVRKLTFYVRKVSKGLYPWGQVWSICIYLSILFSSIEVLPNLSAPYSFIVINNHFQGQEDPIWTLWSIWAITSTSVHIKSFI